MFIVRPTYFRDDEGVTVRSLHLVYDTDNLVFENAQDNGAYMVPNYALVGRGNVVELLDTHFKGKGIPSSQWRLTPPTFRHVDEMGMYLGCAAVLDD